ncbi:MAG: hypothetical protein AAB695_00020 [Patescibacteria group bacterium]
MPIYEVCALIHQASPANGERELLFVDFRSTDSHGKKSEWWTRFPGGTNRLYPAELPEDICNRVVWEEAKLGYQLSMPFWSSETDERVYFAFLINSIDCTGELRKGILLHDGVEVSPPYWASARSLRYPLFPPHQAPLLAGMQYLGL